MARNFPDFIEGYFNYAKRGYVPDQWHRWAGISLLAAVLGRKVGQPCGTFTYRPNLYIVLVSHPGVGKSSAIDPAAELIEAFKSQPGGNPEFKIIPQKITDAALTKSFKIGEVYYVKNSAQPLFHSSGYFYAGEGSNSAFSNEQNSILNALTDYYDCPAKLRKSLASDIEETVLTNVCLNLLTGVTFEFLRTLVDSRSVMNGLASRMLYVTHHDRTVHEDIEYGQSAERDKDVARLLIEDMIHLNRLAGAVRPTKDYMAAWKREFIAHQRFLIDLKSPRLESIYVRKFTHICKLAMLLSISRSDDLIVTEAHLNEAKAMIDDVTKDNPSIVSAAIIADTESQSGCSHLILQTLKTAGGSMPNSILKRSAIKHGNNLAQVSETVDYMLKSGVLLDKGGIVYLTDDPDSYI
jgi:hypothetical protein